VSSVGIDACSARNNVALSMLSGTVCLYNPSILKQQLPRRIHGQPVGRDREREPCAVDDDVDEGRGGVAGCRGREGGDQDREPESEAVRVYRGRSAGAGGGEGRGRLHLLGVGVGVHWGLYITVGERVGSVCGKKQGDAMLYRWWSTLQRCCYAK